MEKRLAEETLQVGDVIKINGKPRRITGFRELEEYTPGMPQEDRIAMFDDGGSAILYRGWGYARGYIDTKEGTKTRGHYVYG